jgi:transposase
LEHAAKEVVLADGAEWIWNLADLHFPGAIQIVDLYHAREYLWELARKLHPNDAVKQKAWMKKHQKRLLNKGKIENLVLTLRAIDSTNPEVVEKLRIEANYFERNAERLLPQVSPPALVCRLGRHRSGMQDRHRLPPQAVRHVLDGSRRQRYRCPAVLPAQRTI